MNQIVPKIFLGDLEDGMDVERLKSAGVTAILNVAGPSHAYQHKEFLCLHLPLLDGPGNTDKELKAAADTLGLLLNEGHTVLVHCLAGVSRSATVIALYLATVTPLTFDQWCAGLRIRRPIVDPHWALRHQAKEILGYYKDRKV